MKILRVTLLMACISFHHRGILGFCLCSGNPTANRVLGAPAGVPEGMLQVRVTAWIRFITPCLATPLNELNGSLLPLATPANSQLWPTNSGQLARVGIVINQFMPLSCKNTFQLWPKTSDTSTLGQSAKCTITGIEVGRAMDCLGRQHIGSRCAVTVL
jgi:hypothetical protein